MKVLIQITLMMLILTAVNSQSLEWTQTYGGPGQDGSEAMVLTSDGNIVMAGFNSLVPYGYKNVLLMKTNSTGSQIWSQTYNLHLNDIGRSLRQTTDGGYIIAGFTEISPQLHDPFLIKTDAQGNVQWQQQYDYGLGSDDRAHAVWQTSDGGFIGVGQTWLIHGQFGNYDIYIFKTDSQGNVQWKKVFFRENEGADVALGVQQLSDGGYIIGGFTQSSEWASYVIRTDNLGNAVWSNIYPGPWQTECYDIRSTPDGGFIMTGTETSYETDGDLFLRKLDANGNSLWNKVYGTDDTESGESLQMLPDGGFIVSGMSSHSGSYDVYVVRTNSSGDSLWTRTIGGGSDDRGHAVSLAPGGGFAVSGWAWSYGQGLGDVYLLKLTETLTGIQIENNIPHQTSLAQNYPNPFNPVTKIDYQLITSGNVKLEIYNSVGQLVETLINRNMNKGIYEVYWNGSHHSSGVYFYTLTVDGIPYDTKKMLLIK